MIDNSVELRKFRKSKKGYSAFDKKVIFTGFRNIIVALGYDY